IVEQQHFDSQVRAIDQVSSKADEARREIAQNLEQNRGAVEQRLDKVRETVDVQLSAIRRDNELKLEAIRATVDEKLATTLNDRLGASFKQVSSQLEAVYRGLGDMQNIASGVGDLKRVLSNVKTRGILGEVQLGAILRDILTADQYAENVATKPGSTERVEFAVKLPVEGGDPIWLPIDSKFPGDTYGHLRDAIEAGDAEGVAAARRALEQVIKAEAKDISSKYLSVPETTNFAIMFLPFEGLYAEVVDRPGLIECLQRDYQVNIAGPSTMAVILNSLQMSYQTFAFQRRADEIQRVLSAVKAEFPKYQAELRRALRQIETAGKTVDGIINTRTNVIERKLKSVTAMEDDALAAELLEISDVSSDVADDEE
uniref:DNA recombination protein RmuC n=1 Tax=Collinsella intestinalis TaxID=147207 RepID=UPI00402626EF